MHLPFVAFISLLAFHPVWKYGKHTPKSNLKKRIWRSTLIYTRRFHQPCVVFRLGLPDAQDRLHVVPQHRTQLAVDRVVVIQKHAIGSNPKKKKKKTKRNGTKRNEQRPKDDGSVSGEHQNDHHFANYATNRFINVAKRVRLLPHHATYTTK